MNNKIKQNYINLIDVSKFQQTVLDYIYSEEFDKMYQNTQFHNSDEYKMAIIHGMCMASILASTRCNSYCLRNDKLKKIKKDKKGDNVWK